MISAGPGDLLSGLLDLASPWAYLLIALLAALEGALLVGLILPGEAAMLLGGVLVANGRAELGVMMAAAGAGAVLGDSLGYLVGRHFGGPLRRSRIGRRIGEERWQRADDHVRRRGGRAVFAGRFVGILRALVPAIAGTTRMRYRTFLAYDAAAAILWTSGFVLAGYLAGNSYERVAEIAGRAGLLLAVVLVAGAGLALAARWVARNPERVMAPLLRLWRTPQAQALATRYARQVALLSDRFRPGAALGLLLTVQLALLALLCVAFVTVLEDVLDNEELVSIDGPVATFVVTHREPWLTGALETVTWAGSAAVLVPLVIAIGLGLRRMTGTWRPLLFLAASLAGASVLSNLIKLAVARARPQDALIDAIGYAFPSGHATNAAAVWLSVALALGAMTANWGYKVALLAVALLIVALVGLSRVYLRVHEATDVLGGWALGGLWVAVMLVSTAVLNHRREG
ncbi:MAG: bifunctional DedA family/phosphatase PAP2 family protein [Solirubrobacteraceae bacterium]